MNKAIVLALALCATLSSSAAGRLTHEICTRKAIGLDRKLYAYQPSQLLGAMPDDITLNNLTLAVTGEKATKTIDGQQKECAEVILYYYFNHDMTGYHPFVEFGDTIVNLYTHPVRPLQDEAENLGKVTMGEHTYDYTWRSRCWIPTEYTSGFFNAKCKDEPYDGDTTPTDAVMYARKGSLGRDAQVVTNYNPAAFTIREKRTTLTPTTDDNETSHTSLDEPTPIVEDTTEYTFSQPVGFNQRLYLSNVDNLRVGTNSVANVLKAQVKSEIQTGDAVIKLEDGKPVLYVVE